MTEQNVTSRDLVRSLLRTDLSEETVLAVDLRTAKRSMVPYRVAEGFAPLTAKLLTMPDENLKLSHSSTDRVAAHGLSLAPADLSGWNVCRFSSAACRMACLSTSGNGRYGSTQRGRIWKTRWLAADPVSFLRVLVAEIDAIKVDAWHAAGWMVSFRFNVLSDLPWEQIAPWLLDRMTARGIRVYDYTKWSAARRDRTAADAVGYHLVDSVTERHTAVQIRRMARPVVVFDVPRGRPLPVSYLGRPVVDADVSDARFKDPAGVVLGLRFKNVATTDRAAAVASGFVRAAS